MDGRWFDGWVIALVLLLLFLLVKCTSGKRCKSVWKQKMCKCFHLQVLYEVSLETENVQMFPFSGFVWKSVWKQNVQVSICRLCMVGLSVSMQEKLSCSWQSCAGSVFTNGEQKKLVLWGYRHLRHLLLCSWHQRHRLASTKWQLPWLLPST